MGREKILKKIKSSSTALVVFGSIFLLIAIFLCIALIADDSLLDAFIIVLLPFVIGILMLIFGARTLANPFKHSMFKKNPYIIQQVDNMLMNKLYEDKFITVSDRCIANKSTFTEIAYLEDVFLVYIQKQSTNFIPTGKLLYLCTATGNIGINIYGSKKATIDELANKISQICPNARFGYNNEGLAYLSQMQEYYKKTNGMINYRGYVQKVLVSPEFTHTLNRLNQTEQMGQIGQDMNYSNHNYGGGYDLNTFKA